MRPIPTALALICTVSLSCTDRPSPPIRPQQSAVALPSSNVIDLTYSFDSSTIYWPTAPGFRRQSTAEGETELGYYYSAGNFFGAEHGGTHLDAPVHFSEGSQTADEIPLRQLMGSAIVIDVADHTAANPDYQIGVEDLQEWESENGPISDGSIVFFRTGFGKFWPDKQRYLGTVETGTPAVAKLHFPGVHPVAAQWLLENRGIKAVGIDTASIDYGQSQLFETHQVLGEANIPIFENVANLDQLPIEGSAVVALPMKIAGGSGGPLRIIAFVP